MNSRVFLLPVLALTSHVALGTAAELPPHPRLVFTADAEAHLRERLGADPVLATLRDAVLVSAEAALSRRTCEHRIPDGKRLLAESRNAIDVVLHTAMAWRLTGDRRFFDRCVKELDAASSLPDWNPPHFLDVAEMATAVAFGLDWLHADLSEPQRSRYRAALESKAIEPARSQLTSGASWPQVRNNWSQVCAGGIMAACAAAADDDEALAATPFDACHDIIHRSARFYEPDGGYPEGPSYWNYGTEYHVVALAIAADLGRRIDTPPHLLAGAAFMAHARGPTDTLFNFSDAGPGTDPFTAARGWLIRRSGDAALAADLRRSLEQRGDSLRRRGGNTRFFPLHLVWLPVAPTEPAPGLPLAATFAGEQPVAMLRSSWTDPRAVFVAAKGGTPGASHGHMDVGSFVYEALGRRWIHDLGPDDYNLPGYFGKNRWDYFRLNSRSHNVLAIGARLQNPACPPCPLIEARTDRPPYAVRFDLTAASTHADERLAARVEREITLDPATGDVHVRDTIVDARDSVQWQCVVDVVPALTGNRAVLDDGTRSLALEITPFTAWRSEPARPATPAEKQNEGFYRLVAEFAAPPPAELVIDVVIRTARLAAE